MISLICGILKNRNKKQKKTKLINTENRLVVARGGGGEGWVKWVKGVKWYQIPIMKT